MLSLFSPIVIGQWRLSNRLALSAQPSGCAALDGFFGPDLANYYIRRAHGGVGLAVIEAASIVPPRDNVMPHVGLYADAHIASLHHAVTVMRQAGATVLVMLDQPLGTAKLSAAELCDLGEAFIRAAWRVHAAGAHGIMLSSADGGPFEQLLSPLRNRRADMYGGSATGRLQLLSDVVAGIARWIGRGFIIGVRLNVEAFAPGGLSLPDARTIATRLASSGVKLIEIGVETAGQTPVARFPGWRVPLAIAIKDVADVAVMVGGLLDDPHLADSVIREGCADIVSIGGRLRVDPDWPHLARAALIER